MAAGSERVPPENEKRRPGQEAADLENGTLNVFQYQMPEAGKQVPAAFDYDSLPDDVRVEAQGAVDKIKGLMRGAIIEVGAALKDIKDRLPHGQFGKWLHAEFGMRERFGTELYGRRGARLEIRNRFVFASDDPLPVGQPLDA
jgi:hypothetical protein